MKEHDKAIEALESCLKVSHPRESIVRKAYAMLAGSYMGSGERGKARASMEQGLQLYPRDPELLFRAGIIYHALGELALAESAYRRLLTERESGHIDSLDVSMTSFKAQHNLALVYLRLGPTSRSRSAVFGGFAGQRTVWPVVARVSRTLWAAGTGAGTGRRATAVVAVN